MCTQIYLIMLNAGLRIFNDKTSVVVGLLHENSNGISQDIYFDTGYEI